MFPSTATCEMVAAVKKCGIGLLQAGAEIQEFIASVKLQWHGLNFTVNCLVTWLSKFYVMQWRCTNYSCYLALLNGDVSVESKFVLHSCEFFKLSCQYTKLAGSREVKSVCRSPCTSPWNEKIHLDKIWHGHTTPSNS